MATKVKTGVIDSSAITSALIANASITADDLHATLDLTGKTVTVATASAGDNDTSVASTAFVSTAIANLADSAPSTLNTLNELAAALGDDASFSTTVTNSIATKLPLAGGTLTGDVQAPGLYVGSTNTSFDFYNNGTSYLNGAVTVDDNLSVTGNITQTTGDYLYTGGGNFDIKHNIASQNIVISTTPSGGSATSRMRITHDGKVGIGTDSPTHKLHVAGTVKVTGTQTFDVDSGGGSYIAINHAGNESWTWGAQSGSGSDDYLDVGLSGSTRAMSWHEDGKVGIGTSAPQAPLEVNGGVSMTGGWGRSMVLRHPFPMLIFQSEYSTDAFAGIGYDNSTGMHFMVNSPTIDPFTSSQTPAMTILDNKNVGIGTNNPTIGKLQVHGGGASGSSTLHLQSDTSTEFNHSINSFNSNLTSGENNLFVLGKAGSTKNSGWIGYKWRSNASDTNQLTFGHWGNNNIVNILGDGKMGVGTETPDTNFHIYSGAVGYGFKNQSQYGYGVEGSNNGSYYHHASDRAMYYWDKPCYANGGFHSYSDSRLKENVTAVTGALDKVALMNGVTFTWDNSEKVRGPEGKQFGVLAQNMLEVDSALPTLNVDPLEEQDNIDDSEKDTDYYSMDYSRLTPFFIEAIKELKTKLEAAEARITTLEG
jgi:hypothetical protein